MSENNNSTKRCTNCQIKLPVIDYKIKPNGDVCKYCDSCRETAREQWHKKTQENKDACKIQQKEKCANDEEYRKKIIERNKERYATDEEYRNKRIERSRISNRVRDKCPDCDKEMNSTSLYDHVKNKCCKGRKLEV